MKTLNSKFYFDYFLEGAKLIRLRDFYTLILGQIRYPAAIFTTIKVHYDVCTRKLNFYRENITSLSILIPSFVLLMMTTNNANYKVLLLNDCRAKKLPPSKTHQTVFSLLLLATKHAEFQAHKK
jgi:hypothetical protein